MFWHVACKGVMGALSGARGVQAKSQGALRDFRDSFLYQPHRVELRRRVPRNALDPPGAENREKTEKKHDLQTR